MRIFKNKRAVSPVVGVILMVAITIVLAATIYIWISSMSNPQATTPSISFRGQVKEDSNNGYYIELTVISVQGSAKWEDLKIQYDSGSGFTDAKVYKDTNQSETPSGIIEAGQTVYIYDSNRSTFESGTITVRIIHTPSNSVIYENTFQVPSS